MEIVATEEVVFSVISDQGLQIVYDASSQVYLASCSERFREK
jgi:hypothetical protein